MAGEEVGRARTGCPGEGPFSHASNEPPRADTAPGLPPRPAVPVLQGMHAADLRTFLALRDFELDPLALFEAAVARTDDRGEVHEHEELEEFLADVRASRQADLG